MFANAVVVCWRQRRGQWKRAPSKRLTVPKPHLGAILSLVVGFVVGFIDLYDLFAKSLLGWMLANDATNARGDKLRVGEAGNKS